MFGIRTLRHELIRKMDDLEIALQDDIESVRERAVKAMHTANEAASKPTGQVVTDADKDPNPPIGQSPDSVKTDEMIVWRGPNRWREVYRMADGTDFIDCVCVVTLCKSRGEDTYSEYIEERIANGVVLKSTRDKSFEKSNVFLALKGLHAAAASSLHEAAVAKSSVVQ